ncbi:Minor extracellular protease vpr [Paramyrothecium foliicola]|nr:Minor extracellular protease vpr [Paramyrothecium foliicola]
MLRSTVSVALWAASTAFAAETAGRTQGPRTVPGAYIVEFDDDANVHHFRRQAEPAYETRVELNYELFHGISIQLSDVDTAEERAAELASLPSVKNIWPVTVFELKPIFEDGRNGSASSVTKRHDQLQKRRDNSTGLADAPIIMTQIDKLHAQGITGEGITIAVVDTGIDYRHPDLGGCFGPGCLVEYGYDFVGDDYDPGWVPPMPDNDPDDCYGHGTHVAGIIAAKENPYFRSAAPGVKLGSYRVLGCLADGTDDVFIAAFNKAYEDGADIITASIGYPSGWGSTPFSLAVSRIVEKGIPCTMSAGNGAPYYGSRGLFDGTSAADGKGVVAVASFDSHDMPSMLPVANFTIDGKDETTFFFQPGGPSNFDGVERKVWVTGYDLENDQDACSPLPHDTPDLSEYNVLVRRPGGRCTPYIQSMHLSAKGARFLTVYNNQPGLWTAFAAEGNITAIAAVSQEVGEGWVRALEAGSEVTTVMTYDDSTELRFHVQRGGLTAGALSYYSSWGPNFDMGFKPQFGAPGRFIYSTYPVDSGGYILMSGTSMSTPLVASAYALIAQVRGRKPTPALFEQLLSSTAKTQLFQRTTVFEDWLAPAAQQGAGLIQVYDAAYATSYFEPSSLSFNDTANFAGTLNFTIVNDGKDEATYSITHVATNSMYMVTEDGIETYYGFGPDFPEHAELEFSTSKVTLGPGDSVSIAVTATPPKGLDESRYPYWSGFITANGTDGSSLTLPYQGLTGSLYEAQAIYEDDRSLYMADSLNWGIPVPANQTYTLPAPGEWADSNDHSLPVLAYRMFWGSPQVMVDVVPLTTCPPNSTTTKWGHKSIGQMAGAPNFFAPRTLGDVIWYGRLQSGEYAPPGRYKVVFSVLRIFGDPSKESDWFATETLPFVLNYAEPTKDGERRQ